MIVVADRIVQKIRTHARASYPEECCGVLIGADERVTESRPLTNAWPEWGRKQRFQTEGRELVALEKEFSGKNVGVVGFYHSHPDAPAWPSPFDLERSWPVYLYFILSIRDSNPGELRAWRKNEVRESFEELEIKVIKETASKVAGRSA